MAGKVVLVKTHNTWPKLIPATALRYDKASDTVLLDREIAIEDQEPSNIVPKSRCFEFDADLMEHVNALTEAVIMKTSAVQQLCDAGLTEAEFILDGPQDDDTKLICH